MGLRLNFSGVNQRLAGGRRPLAGLIFSIVVVVGPGSAAGGDVPSLSKVRLSAGERSVVTEFDFRGQGLRVAVPRALGAASLDHASGDPGGRISVTIGAHELEFDRSLTLAAAFAVGRVRLDNPLGPGDVTERNQLADRSEFARLSGEMRHMLDLALPRHPKMARALGDGCELSCAEAGLKLVADGVAAAVLIIARDDDVDLSGLVARLVDESAAATAVRVGLACPACTGSACTAETTRRQAGLRTPPPAT